METRAFNSSERDQVSRDRIFPRFVPFLLPSTLRRRIRNFSLVSLDVSQDWITAEIEWRLYFSSYFDRDTRERASARRRRIVEALNFCQFTGCDVRQASDDACMKGRARRVVFIYVKFVRVARVCLHRRSILFCCSPLQRSCDVASCV